MKYCLTSEIIVNSSSPFHDNVVTETFSSIITDTPLLLQDIHTVYVRQTKPKYMFILKSHVVASFFVFLLQSFLISYLCFCCF